MDDIEKRLARLVDLTEREHEVLRLSCEGLGDQAVADALVISRRTVLFHKTNIYRKLGIAGLSQAPRQRELGRYCQLLAQVVPVVSSGEAGAHPEVLQPTNTPQALPTVAEHAEQRNETPVPPARIPFVRPVKMMALLVAIAMLGSLMGAGCVLLVFRGDGSPSADRVGGSPDSRTSPATGTIVTGAVALGDNFDDPAKGLLPRQAPPGDLNRLGYVGGEFAIGKAAAAGNPSTGVVLPGEYRDVTITFDLRAVSSFPPNVLVWCRYAVVGNRVSGYRLDVMIGAGSLQLWQYTDGQATSLLGRLPSPAINRGAISNRVELRCAGSRITITINGVELGTVEDSAHQVGYVRIGVFGVDTEDLEVRLDNLAVIPH